MDQSREILVIVLQTQIRDDFIRMRLQLWCELRVGFRSKDLYRHVDGIDLLFGQEGRVGDGDAVDEAST